MFRRAVSLAAATESVWRALTEPGAVEDWFGARVEWDLRPGGAARFRPLAGSPDGDTAGSDTAGSDTAGSDTAGSDTAGSDTAGAGPHGRPRPDDGAVREDRAGVVEAVEPGRHLRFRWWPTGDETDVSEIAYDLEPDGEGTTTLTVTERPLRPATRRDAPVAAAVLPAAAPVSRADPLRLRPDGEISAGPGWSTADQRRFEVWAATTMPAVGAGR